MVKRELPYREKESVQKGRGTVGFSDLAAVEETYGHVRLFSTCTLRPGCSIGYHTHENETEFYYILQGEAVVNDNGTELVMKPGQVMSTGDGAGHSIENLGKEDLVFLAMIVTQ